MVRFRLIKVDFKAASVLLMALSGSTEIINLIPSLHIILGLRKVLLKAARVRGHGAPVVSWFHTNYPRHDLVSANFARASK